MSWIKKEDQPTKLELSVLKTHESALFDLVNLSISEPKFIPLGLVMNYEQDSVEFFASQLFLMYSLVKREYVLFEMILAYEIKKFSENNTHNMILSESTLSYKIFDHLFKAECSSFIRNFLGEPFTKLTEREEPIEEMPDFEKKILQHVDFVLHKFTLSTLPEIVQHVLKFLSNICDIYDVDATSIISNLLMNIMVQKNLKNPTSLQKGELNNIQKENVRVFGIVLSRISESGGEFIEDYMNTKTITRNLLERRKSFREKISRFIYEELENLPEYQQPSTNSYQVKVADFYPQSLVLFCNIVLVNSCKIVEEYVYFCVNKLEPVTNFTTNVLMFYKILSSLFDLIRNQKMKKKLLKAIYSQINSNYFQIENVDFEEKAILFSPNVHSSPEEFLVFVIVRRLMKLTSEELVDGNGITLVLIKFIHILARNLSESSSRSINIVLDCSDVDFVKMNNKYQDIISVMNAFVDLFPRSLLVENYPIRFYYIKDKMRSIEKYSKIFLEKIHVLPQDVKLVHLDEWMDIYKHIKNRKLILLPETTKFSSFQKYNVLKEDKLEKFTIFFTLSSLCECDAKGEDIFREIAFVDIEDVQRTFDEGMRKTIVMLSLKGDEEKVIYFCEHEMFVDMYVTMKHMNPEEDNVTDFPENWIVERDSTEAKKSTKIKISNDSLLEVVGDGTWAKPRIERAICYSSIEKMEKEESKLTFILKNEKTAVSVYGKDSVKIAEKIELLKSRRNEVIKDRLVEYQKS